MERFSEFYGQKIRLPRLLRSRDLEDLVTLRLMRRSWITSSSRLFPWRASLFSHPWEADHRHRSVLGSRNLSRFLIMDADNFFPSRVLICCRSKPSCPLPCQWLMLLLLSEVLCSLPVLFPCCGTICFPRRLH